MSIKVMTMVFDRYPVGGNERLLALAMADEANDAGERIFPSVATLAHKSFQSERSVQRLVHRMLSTGWLILVKRSSGRRGDCNEYKISPQWIAGDEPIAPPEAPDRRTCAKRTGDKLAPVAAHEKGVTFVDKLSTTGDTQGLSGDTQGLSGDRAVSPNPVLPISTHIPPLPPVDTGGCGQSPKPKPQKPAGKAQGQGAAQAGQGGQREATPWRWHQSRSGIEREGQRLGLGCWDEAGFQAGRGEAFAAYERRVLRAWEVERAAAQAQAQAQAAGAACGRQGVGA